MSSQIVNERKSRTFLFSSTSFPTHIGARCSVARDDDDRDDEISHTLFFRFFASSFLPRPKKNIHVREINKHWSAIGIPSSLIQYQASARFANERRTTVSQRQQKNPPKKNTRDTTSSSSSAREEWKKRMRQIFHIFKIWDHCFWVTWFFFRHLLVLLTRRSSDRWARSTRFELHAHRNHLGGWRSWREWKKEEDESTRATRRRRVI